MSTTVHSSTCAEKMKRKLSILSIAVSGILVATLPLFQNPEQFLRHFDDPAVKACRSDLLKKSGFPHNYEETSSKIEENKVTIAISFKDEDGTNHTQSQTCSWFYHKGKFNFQLPFAYSEDLVISEASRRNNLRRDGLYTIKASSTSLSISNEDIGIDACINHLTKDNPDFLLPPTYRFQATVSGDAIRQITLFSALPEDDNSLPSYATCKADFSKKRIHITDVNLNPLKETHP